MMSYAETIYPSAARAQDSLTHSEYRLYGSVTAGFLLRNYAAQRDNKETI